MANTTRLTGYSQSAYTYHYYDMLWEPAANQNGNYAFAKVVNRQWQLVYVGQGDLKERRADHLRKGDVTKKGATHYLCHLNSSNEARLYEESDLLANHQEAYVPTGCNVKIGG